MNAQTLVTITPEIRAAQLLSFDETEAELTTLAKQSERITKINNKAARDECHSSLMVLKSRRVDIEKRGKEARDDANKFAKAVIAKEKELIGFIAPEEERLQLLRDQWDTAEEVARLEKLEAERLRVEAIQKRIDEIRNLPSTLVGKPSVIIAGQLAKLRADELSEDEFAEHFIIAREAHTTAIVRVEQLLAAQQDADAEKKRQAERDAEMEAMRVKMAEQQRLIDEAEEAKRVERERLVQVERDRVAAEEAAARAAEQARLDDIARVEREEQDRIRAEKAEADRMHREQEEATLQAERDRQAAEQRKLDDQAAQLKRDKQAAAAKAEADRLANLGLREAAKAVVRAFHPGEYAVVDDLDAVLARMDSADESVDAPAKPSRVKKEVQA